MPARDWERTLKETSYDLPQETWQRLENDMRGWLAQEARSPRPSPPWYVPFLAGFRTWKMGLAGAVATCAIAFGAWYSLGDRISWSQGQALDAHGNAHWNWTAERCRIDGNNARLVLSSRGEKEVGIVLERGEATFHVQHRRADESFAVEVGDCKIHVVGTVFTVGVDSLRSWVAVQEGRIRMDHPRFQEFVDAGQKSACSERKSSSASVAAAVVSGSATAPISAVPTGPTGQAVSAPIDIVGKSADSIAVPTCHEGAACVRILSEFVRLHPDHSATPDLALRWARLTSRAGDTRDALVAYGIAASSPALAEGAQLESLRMRSEQLSQDRQVADSLEVWIPRLRTGSATWHQAWILRGDVARRLGDATAVERARKMLDTPASAEGGQ